MSVSFVLKAAQFPKMLLCAYHRLKVHNYVLPVATTAPARASAMSFIRRTELKKTRG
jgi:hypothetical protein